MVALPAIDFHVHVEHGIGYACRVVRKARAAGCTVLVHSDEPERLARLDQALWTFSILDFLPHVDADSALAPRTPVWLSAAPVQGPGRQRDVLVLLGEQPVAGFRDWFPSFSRVIDIVEAGDEPTARGRDRFRAYRDAGFAPRRHEIPAT
jgi:DNA polymerase-3 subunit chi